MTTNSANKNHTPIQLASSLLKAGKLVAIPTETVYGLGADALNPEAVLKIYQTKGRPSTNPLIIHLPNIEAMSNWAIDIPSHAWKIAEQCWPGPLTLVLQKHPRVPKIVTANQETIALRIPNHPLTLNLLKEFGSGIAAPSANRYGRISPTQAQHVQEELGNKVDYILDGGPCTVGIESTILSFIEKEPLILRQGSISSEELTKILGYPITVSSHSTITQVPGLSESHYAPATPLFLIEKESFEEAIALACEKNLPFGVLSFSEKPKSLPENVYWILASNHSNIYARDLYVNLRTLDTTHSHCILVEKPPTTTAWLAIQDRLQRAAYSSSLSCI